MLAPGDAFPNFFFRRTDGTQFELHSLRKKEHALLLFVDTPNAEVFALIQRFQEKRTLFEWLQTRLVAVFPDTARVSSPWPAPHYAPCLYENPLPEGLDWGKGYLISRNRSLFSIYPELEFLSAQKVEDDVLHWEAVHCLP